MKKNRIFLFLLAVTCLTLLAVIGINQIDDPINPDLQKVFESPLVTSEAGIKNYDRIEAFLEKMKSSISHQHNNHLKTFYFDFEKIVHEFREKGIEIYPDPTKLKLEIVRGPGKDKNKKNVKLGSDQFEDLKFKLVILQRVPFTAIGDMDND